MMSRVILPMIRNTHASLRWEPCGVAAVDVKVRTGSAITTHPSTTVAALGQCAMEGKKKLNCRRIALSHGLPVVGGLNYRGVTVH
jgi:hypothetical protein